MGIDRTRLNRYSINDRASKISRDNFARECEADRSFAAFLESLPRVLQSQSLLDLVEAIIEARANDKAVLFMFGAHVVKTGISPLVCQALREGWITYPATNGAGTIHDLELACYGATSERVEETIGDGSFGMALETGRDWNEAIKKYAQGETGLGESIGSWISERSPEGAKDSVCATAVSLGRPVTAHVAIGADITHPHPEADGGRIGAASYRDFEILCERVAEIDEGGVVLNVGSAVLLPEVFIKALSVARNLSGPVSNFTTANLDMQRHYRPRVNVLDRPTRGGGRSVEIIGPHEILLPLLFQGVCERISEIPGYEKRG